MKTLEIRLNTPQKQNTEIEKTNRMKSNILMICYTKQICFLFSLHHKVPNSIKEILTQKLMAFSIYSDIYRYIVFTHLTNSLCASK